MTDLIAARCHARRAITPAEARPAVALIGIGNLLRGDDGAGLELARLVRARADPRLVCCREHAADMLALIDALDGYRAAVLVDALHGGGPPGSLRRFDLSARPLADQPRHSSSSHAVGVSEALELTRALGRLPARVILFGVEGASFRAGDALSPSVRRVLPSIAGELLAELHTLALAPAGASR